MASVSEGSCVNDPNFAIICSFFEKFSSMLNIQQPDIHTLQEWLENSDEVAPGLRQLHIKLLRKMRKTVHETAWETALAKFCYLYSAQDAWEIERFGYKKSSLKVKLRILTAILEYQFQLNGKFRNKFSNMSAEELRSEPIGRDRLGHSYWLTQDPSCNFRIYQEHLDEEIWQVVASNRSEMQTLISRLKGNEVVLPSLIGVIDEDSSSNSCANAIIKPPPPEEQDDSQSSSGGGNSKAKVPNIKIKLENGNIVEKNGNLTNGKPVEPKIEPKIKPDIEEEAENEDEEESAEEEEEDEDEEEHEDDEEEEAEDEEDEEEDDDDEENEDKKSEDKTEEQVKSTERAVKDDKGDVLTNGTQKEAIPTSNGQKTVPRKLKPLVISNSKLSSPSEDKSNTKKRALSTSINGEPETDQPASKKNRPILSDDRRGKKSKYEKSSEEDDDDEEGDEDEAEEEEDGNEDEEAEENDDDDAAEEDEEAINGNDDANGDEEEMENGEKEVGEAIEEKVLIVKGEGSGKNCESSSSCFLRKIDYGCEDNEEQVGEAIEEEVMYIYGEGSGQCCLVGNPHEENNQTESILLKHSESIDLQSKGKQAQEDLIQPDENKNDENNKGMTNGETGDEKENSEKKVESLIKSENENRSSEDLKNTENQKDLSNKSNDSEDITVQSDAVKEPPEDCTNNHKTEEAAKLNEKDEEISALKKDEVESAVTETKTEEKSEIESTNGNNVTSETKDTPKSNFDLDRSSEPPDIETSKIESKDDDPPSTMPDLSPANSRKRRLSEEKVSRDLSESESDLNSDSAAPPTEEEDIGGKKPKMRLKVVNTEIRKKVEEARKSHDDSKSTSEEEDPVQDDKNSENCEVEEEDPLQISEQDLCKAEATAVDTDDVPKPVMIQTRTTRHTPAGTQIKMLTSGRGRKKPGKQRYTKRIAGIPSLQPVAPIVDGETRSEDDPDSNKMPKLEPATGPIPEAEIKTSPGQKKPRGRKRDIDTSNIIDTQTETPVRQSRRIAQLKIREEAERRKLEEEALKKMKAEFKKKKKEENTSKGVPVASDSSEKSEEDSEAEEGKKFSSKKKGGRMWKKSGWSSGPDEPEEDDEYDLHHDRYDSDRGCSPLFKSDHEFSPESDIEDESQVVPLKRARTVRKEGAEDDGNENLDESCQKCGKNDHPEWILLCDKCDKGYHCSCLSPVLFIIPEGDWFCPPCQQEQLIMALESQLTVLDDAVEQKRIREEEAKKAEIEQKLKEEEELARVKEETTETKEVTYQAKKNRAERAKRRHRPKIRKPFIADDDDESEESEDGDSFTSGSSSDGSESGSKSSSKTSDSEDNEPIYKLRKRRQVNVSYRLNEYEDLINSAIKEEMDEVAGAGNLGRGKDISTIIEADKEEKMRQKQLTTVISQPDETTIISNVEVKDDIENGEANDEESDHKVKEEEEKVTPPVKSKSRSVQRNIKKKSRKLNNLDISSDDDGSDEDFKTSSYDTEEDESISESTDSDSSLEVYRKRGKKNRKNKKERGRRPQRRVARERRRLDDFIVEDSEWSDEAPKRRKVKRKHNWELQDTESEDDLSDQIDSEELCDDTTDSEDSDGCWRPSKRRKTKGRVKGAKSKGSSASRLGPRGGKQPRKFNRKDSTERSFKSKSKSKMTHDSDDSDEDVPRTRGKRFTYLDSFDEESSDDGIKPGVKRPDTPPEEREKFIKKQEEIKRMLAEKNTEAAKAVATPTLAPVDSLSTVPLSVIKGAKVLDLDYLQRKGELNSDEGETDFDEDLPDDFDPEAMDEEEIAKMMEEEDFAQQQIKVTNDVIRPKKKENEALGMSEIRLHPIVAPHTARESSGPQLQEPPRKRLPMPTLHPPLSGMSRFLPPGARVPHETPIRQYLPPTVPLSMQSALQSRPMGSGIGGISAGHSSIIPSVVGAPSHPIAGQNQNSIAEPAKPRGRRKKITPLRDTLQKQQAAAAAAAASSAPVTVPQATSVTAVKEISLMTPDKSPTAIMGGPAQLSVAQPPQLYAPPTNTPPSVITRMPQVSSVQPPAQQPPLLAQPPQLRPPRPPFPEQNSRFYSPPNQIPPHRMSIIRHGAPMPPPPSHHPLGPNFASGPPPLRPASPRIPASVGNVVVNRQPSPRPLTTFATNDQYGAARPPPPPQHPNPPHAYRPPLYGTPGYPPAPPQQPQTPMHPTAPDYSSVPASYGPTPPYGGPYYPPPPPQPNIGPTHSTPPTPTVSAVPVSSPVPLPSLPASIPASAVPQPAPAVPSVTAPSTPPHSLPIPVPPAAEPAIVGQASQPSRPKASILETFDSKSRSPILEADVQSSPYSNSGIAEDQEEEHLVASPPANTTSEFSGLVSYFSSQHDDLNS